MKIERVDGNRRIRVLLTQSDLSEMNINIGTLTSDSPELHSFLFRIMDFIKEETGFNASSGQIIVEALPSDGGVILTVTKITPERKQVKLKPKNVRIKKTVHTKRIYRFDSFDSVTDYLSVANSASLSKTALFKFDETFFALTREHDLHILEFARAMPLIGTDKLFFSEHGSMIAEGDELIKMAEELKKLK